MTNLLKASLLLGLFSFAGAGATAVGQEMGVRELLREPHWPAALHQRNARYAQLKRCVDQAGDLLERKLMGRIVSRETDLLGDLEEERRHLANLRHRATLYAELVRGVDRGGDDDQQVLASRTLSRKHARFHRLLDLKSDKEVVLSQYRKDLLRYGMPGRHVLGIADQAPDSLGILSNQRRRDRRKVTKTESETRRILEREERGSFTEERQTSRSRSQEEAELDRELEALEADLERSEENEELSLERELEGIDAELERELEQDQERSEDSVERSAERSEERSLEQAEEQALQQ